jgi:hypothetical protein
VADANCNRSIGYKSTLCSTTNAFGLPLAECVCFKSGRVGNTGFSVGDSPFVKVASLINIIIEIEAVSSE